MEVFVKGGERIIELLDAQNIEMPISKQLNVNISKFLGNTAPTKVGIAIDKVEQQTNNYKIVYRIIKEEDGIKPPTVKSFSESIEDAEWAKTVLIKIQNFDAALIGDLGGQNVQIENLTWLIEGEGGYKSKLEYKGSLKVVLRSYFSKKLPSPSGGNREEQSRLISSILENKEQPEIYLKHPKTITLDSPIKAAVGIGHTYLRADVNTKIDFLALDAYNFGNTGAANRVNLKAMKYLHLNNCSPEGERIEICV